MGGRVLRACLSFVPSLSDSLSRVHSEKATANSGATLFFLSFCYAKVSVLSHKTSACLSVKAIPLSKRHSAYDQVVVESAEDSKTMPSDGKKKTLIWRQTRCVPRTCNN